MPQEELSTTTLAGVGKPTILQEAAEIICGRRQEDYGGAHADFDRVAAMWSVILGCPVEGRQVPLCMIALKIGRECHKPRRDNRVDIAGYAQCLDAYEEAEEDREVPS